MIRRSIVLWLFLSAVAGISMFLIKHEVQFRHGELTQLNRQIVTVEEALLVSKAECSYLTRPVRIEDLARRLIKFRPTETHQLVTIESLPFPLSPSPNSKVIR